MKTCISTIGFLLCAAVLTFSPTALQCQTIGTAIWWGEINGAGSSNQLRVVAAGNWHNLAITSEGTVVAWGSSAGGATTVPEGLNGVIAIAGGGSHSLAARTNGQLVAWGANSDGQATVPAGLSNVVGVAAGNVHSVALKSDGTVRAWGYNGQGQCTVPAGLSNVTAIASRGYHVVALKADGTVSAWGDNAAGQCNVPANLHGIAAIAAGGEHSVALGSNGTIVAWGNNTYGQCTSPTNLGPFIAIGAGWYHTLGLKADHTVVAWGAGHTNLHNFPHVGQSIVPSGLSNVVALSAGVLHSLALFVEPPRIEIPPTNQTVLPGSMVNFLVGAAGAPPLRYHWFFNFTNLVAVEFLPSLQLPNVLPVQAGAYTVVITNQYGAVTSAPAILRVATSPIIVADPTNLTVAIDDPANFYVSAVGTSLSYQWLFRGTGAIPGATSSVLHFDHAQSAQAGEYSVVVTNGFGGVTSAPAMLNVVPRAGVVNNATEAALRAAMVFGGNVTFACDGTITLASTITNQLDLTLDGAGHDVTISGANAVRLFFMPSNSSLTVRNLKLYNGRALKGAGIFNDGGNLTLTGVVMGGNAADQMAESELVNTRFETGEGAAVFNRGGVVNADACSFVNNAAYQRPDDFQSSELQARGGAIRNLGGVVHLRDCQFTGNFASGGPTMGPMYYSRDAAGGAIHNSGTLTATRCSFLRNVARGEPNTITMYPGFAGGSGTGGAIFNDGTLALSACLIASNSASGGSGGVGSTGCADCPGLPSYPGGPGGAGGSAIGGGLFNTGTAGAVNCTFAWNSCAGASGGSGGSGGPGHFHGISGSDGGNGGNGGGAFGGGIYGATSLTNCTLAFNFVSPGAGGPGGMGGPGMPPGVSGTPGVMGNSGPASGGGIKDGFLFGSLLATNNPGGNASGAMNDFGFNLSSDATCNFTQLSSLNNADVRIGFLTNNGGPTLTIALLADSPAIDATAGANSPPLDQRGFPRPAGLAGDIGAYEFGSMLPTLTISSAGNGELAIRVCGNSNHLCRLLTSPDLTNWQCVATNQIGADGAALFPINSGHTENQRFYKAVMP